MKAIKNIWILTIVFNAGVANSQLTGITTIIPGKNISLKSKNPLLPVAEPHLAINPWNSKHLIAAAIIYDSAKISVSATHVGIFVSRDGGKTWRQTDLAQEFGYDPWVAVIDSNKVAVAALARVKGIKGMQLVVYLSEDGGISWNNPPVFLGTGHDHPTMIVDDFKKRLYLLSVKGSSTISLNYSDNYSDYQPNPFLFTGSRNLNTLTVVLQNDGTVLIPYLDFSITDGAPVSPRILINKTTDGKTLSNPVLITENTGLTKGFPVFAVSKGGKYKDRIFLLKNSRWKRDESEGLYIQYSDNSGEIWSKEIRVDNPHNEGIIYLGTANMAVSDKGVIGICWYERNDREKKKNDVYFTASLDGGISFLPKIKVTEVSSDPNSISNGKAAERHFTGGDYMGCVAKPDGSFQILWADSRSGVYQLYTSEIKIVSK
ncbi:MAG TPA: sialidase family protein [Chitinophagaceae bacterium]|nr:sialidase family protein [Chitinophagaceae bacterium]